MKASARWQAATWRMALVAVLALLIGSVYAASAAEAPHRGRLLTVTADTAWNLVGEWDEPNRDHGDPWSHYTKSIVIIDGAYYLAYDGPLLGGCCFWPQVWALESTEDGALLDPYTDTTYRVRDDGLLAIRRRSGTEILAPRTRGEAMFSNGWREGIRR